MTQFTTDWFPRRVFDEVLPHLKKLPNFRILEIGTFEGRGALYFLSEFMPDSGELTCVDPFFDIYFPDFSAWNPAEVKTRFLRNTERYARRLTLLEKKSHDAWPSLPAGSFDLVFVDGDHRMQAVAEDAREGFRVTKPGGHLVFDDYRWGVDLCYPPVLRPKEAIDLFLLDFGSKLEILHQDYCVVVQKK
jgi:predicted O-methyltransferase YrrM